MSVETENPLPPQVTVPFAGQDACTLTLRYDLPKIWTQAQSRRFGLYWSDALAFGKVYPEPTSQELDRFYDTARYDEYMSGTQKAQAARSVLDRVLTKAAWHSDRSEPPAAAFLAPYLTGAETVCDVGCGSGVFLSQIAPQVAAVTGVDPSAVSLRTLAAKGMEGHPGTGEALPEAFAGRQFDLVSMQQSLEHCLDPGRALANLRSICRDGGHCLIEVPNHENFGFEKYGAAWFHADVGRHVHFFTAKSLVALMEHAGFAPAHTGYLSYTRQFAPEWISAMQDVWDNLYGEAADPEVPRPEKIDKLRDFLASVGLPKARKYDVLRVYARAV